MTAFVMSKYFNSKLLIYRNKSDMYYKYDLCIAMELVHKRNRAYCGAIFNSSFAVGACMVPIYGYLIRNITTLQTVYGMHALVLLGYWWYVFKQLFVFIKTKLK